MSSAERRSAVRAGDSSRAAKRTLELDLGGGCELGCPLCDVREGAPDDVQRAVEGGAARLVVRGARAGSPRLGEVIRAGRARGVRQIVVATHGLAYVRPEAARALAGAQADRATVPLFSSAARAHDRIAGAPDALARALVGMRSLGEAGLGIEVEIPLLSSRLQSLEALVALAHRAVPSALRAVRFFVSPRPVPPVLAPPRWSEAAPGLAAALRLCRELGLDAPISGQDAIPLCALRGEPSLLDAHRFDPRRDAKLAAHAAHAEPCTRCAARPQCPGLARSYRDAHGAADIEPYERRPAAMYAQRTPGSPTFTIAHRRLASDVGMLVLRPTVNCNQDCTFCSANETSNNVWTDPKTMLRAIVRAAQRGIPRVSFGGGEPTLSRDLVHYVAAARRLGIPKIEIVTNAVLLDREARVRALREAGLTHAFVSLHAFDERLSQVMTRKVGDHARTLEGVRNLRAAGVITVVNHVITSRNHEYLTRFVELIRERFEGGAMISFAFVTPQYKVLEDMSQVPSLAEVMPHLRRALYRALELGQPVQIGSRQGIPPCLLGEFQGWSDLFQFASEPASEDAPQKQRAAACDACRYASRCTGLWRPYVARHGLAELRPVVGEPLSDDVLGGGFVRSMRPPFHVPMAFEDLPPELRDPAAEAEGRAWYALGTTEPAPVRALPVVAAGRSRPVRVLLVGSGRQARRLARAVRDVSGISVDAVASPHAPEADLRELGGCAAFRSMEDAIVEMRPEAIVLAASTHAHHALARAALERRIPTLIEKPLARTEEEAEDLLRAASDAGVPLVPAHNVLFAPGLAALLDPAAATSIAFQRRTTRGAPDSVQAWSRAALSEVLHHALALVGHAAGGGVPRVHRVVHHGDDAPERVGAVLEYRGGVAEIDLDFTASADETVLARGAAGAGTPEQLWRRAGRVVSLRVGGAEVPVERDGTDVARMLAHFRDVVRGGASPLVTPGAALDVMRATRAVIEALGTAGAPFDRVTAPRHVASPAMAAPGVPRTR